MSVKGRKAGLAISWQKSFSILAPWRKGKGNKEPVPDGEVVLTKMKLFSHFPEKILVPSDSTKATASLCDISASGKVSEVNSHLDNKSGRPQRESSSDYLSAIFSASKLPRLYKFESEDSGVELPSGANSPSTPTGSEQSFVVHSRESSCDLCNLNSDPTTLTDKLTTYAQTSENNQAEDSVESGLCTAVTTPDGVEGLNSSAVMEELHISEDVDRDQKNSPEISPEGDEMSGKVENGNLPERTCFEHMRTYGKHSSVGACDGLMGGEFEPKPLRRSSTSESLEEYMEECCKLSEAQQENSNPLGSGLGYLEHICQLLKKIGQLQETNLRLQRQICNLQKDSRMAKTKEDFFRQYCSCGAASLAFQEVAKKQSRSECLSPSGTLSDLSTIPEVSRQPFLSTRRDTGGGGGGDGLRRRGLNRMSYTEGEVRFLGESTDRLSSPRRRMSDSYAWGRVKDLVRKTKLRNQNRLGLTSTSLKMSCPQLYMPDLGSVKLAGRQRNSMISLGHQSKLDFLWQQ
ncbi:uncharacterized protein si:ch211-250c4.3 [Antennarius striatus]|uniref:uncharacterized protein si:ch211-250c4.3 n=1 Tax=Antennarius striatus TaxID=241820 RepID=UPI0035B1832E